MIAGGAGVALGVVLNVGSTKWCGRRFAQSAAAQDFSAAEEWLRRRFLLEDLAAVMLVFAMLLWAHRLS